MGMLSRLAFFAALLLTLSAPAASGSAASFERAKAVAAAIDSTCALTMKSGVECWGYNGHDELGHGTNTFDSSRPVTAVGLQTGVTAIAAGVRHHCALVMAGNVKCWGANYSGALGDGTEERHAEGPVDVLGVGGASAISAGHDFSCALIDGGVKCWGDNSQGMLGDGTKETRMTPVDVVGLSSGVTAIESGILQSCALMNDGGVRCWGGLLGTSPVAISGLNGQTKAITSGCALMESGGVKCWYANATAAEVPGLASGIDAISGEGLNHCALTSTGRVKCWGDNEFGQLGDGTTDAHATPIDIRGLGSGVTSVATGSFHSCAITRGGGIKCWGVGGTGQLGNGNTEKFSRPVSVLGFGPRAKVSILPGSVRVTSGRTAPIPLRCGTDMSCQGKLTLVGFGSRTFAINAGRTKIVAIKLTARALDRLHRAKRLATHAKAVYKQADGSQTAQTRAIVLVAP
jgi:alpha-tubulin suppressor-like RCC1 family protein